MTFLRFAVIHSLFAEFLDITFHFIMCRTRIPFSLFSLNIFSSSDIHSRATLVASFRVIIPHGFRHSMPCMCSQRFLRERGPFTACRLNDLLSSFLSHRQDVILFIPHSLIRSFTRLLTALHFSQVASSFSSFSSAHIRALLLPFLFILFSFISSSSLSIFFFFLFFPLNGDACLP